MCGRYALYGPISRARPAGGDEPVSDDDAADAFIAALLDKLTAELPPRYNIAPQQGNPKAYVPVVRIGEQGDPETASMQWWLLPHWSKERRIKYTTFNARVETVQTAASFRTPFRRRRCLIPVNGWYEWQELPTGNLPWYYHARSGSGLLFAGLWDRWEGRDEIVESCSIIVGPANKTMDPIHDRMPFIIPPERQQAWLDPTLTDADRVMQLLQPAPENLITAHRVDKRVNNARNEGAVLIEKIAVVEREAGS